MAFTVVDKYEYNEYETKRAESEYYEFRGKGFVAGGVRNDEGKTSTLPPKQISDVKTSSFFVLDRLRNGVRSNLRGVSIRPLEITAGGARLQRKQEITLIPSGKNRRGISLGPSKIASGVRSQRGK
ncbi:hypothetical protein IFM89_015922 [Coptis chinensis]|uniref:Uncharacterized protein n=1 Tax=Coptis chinensis TaxID=261450 RepID=A0A835LZM4_9MAGN|nr:hypothetical protein IFM89_015922 [Coptis chinensis]